MGNYVHSALDITLKIFALRFNIHDNNSNLRYSICTSKESQKRHFYTEYPLLHSSAMKNYRQFSNVFKL